MTESRLAPPAIANREVRRNGARKRRLPLALLVVPVVLVGLGVALIMTVSGGGGGGTLGGDNGDEEAPPFDFRIGRVTVERTVADADVAELESQAEALVQDEITPLIDELFTDAYLDPANWRAGDYDEIFELFTNGAAATARTGVETITLGASAGDVFEDVTPRRGGVDYSVLFDRDNAPHTVVARVRFYATGERKDGTYLAIVSAGQLFLRDLDGWTIVGFDLRRNDHDAPPPTPAPSGASPGATGTS